MTRKAEKTNVYVRLYHLLRLLQQRNKFVSRLNESNVSLVESHFLVELQANPVHTCASLTELLCIDQSSVSRIGGRLERAGYIRKVQHRSDKRRTQLSITSRGNKLVETIDVRAEHIITELRRGVTAAQFADIVALFRCIADGYQQPAGIQRPGESDFRVQQRRVTRALRLLGSTVHETEFCSLDWQILVETSERSVQLTAGQLVEMLSTPLATVSASIIRLEKLGFVQRYVGPHDRRQTVLEATRAGRQRAQEIETAAATRLRDVLTTDVQRIQEQLAALTAFVGDIARGSDFIPPEYTLRQVHAARELMQLRGFAIRQLVANQLEESAPETILAGDSEVFCLEKSGEVVAVFEVQNNQVNFSAWQEKLHVSYLHGALAQMARKLNIEPQMSSEYIRYPALLGELT